MKLQRLQVLRAAAALLVVWVHSINLASHDASVPWQARIGHFEHFGAAGVDIFFVISGFIIALGATRASGWRDFLLRRLARIWPLYAVLTLLLLGLRLATHVHVDLPLLLSSLLFVQLPGHVRELPFLTLGWSLMFEMYFYLVVALALAWPARWAVRMPLLGRVALMLAVPLLLGPLLHFPQPLNVMGNPVVLEFLMGVGVSLIWQRGGWLPQQFGPVAALLGAGLLGLSGYRGFGLISEAPLTLDASLSVPRLLQWGVPAALLVLGVVCVRSPWRGTRPGRALMFLGDASYSIYLSSFISLAVLLHGWHLLSRLGGDLGILGALLLTLLVGVACHLLLERPLARWLHFGVGRLPDAAPGMQRRLPRWRRGALPSGRLQGGD